MIACGNCGKSAGTNDVTCPHCNALLAAWASAPDDKQPVHYAQPEYARPPAATPMFPTTTPAIDDVTATRLVSTIHAMDRATATRLINTIRAYARARETESRRELATTSQLQIISKNDGEHGAPISNIAFAIGTILIVVLILMWGIVGAMVYTEMLSIGFMVTTIVLTLAFKPTMNSIRRVFQK